MAVGTAQAIYYQALKRSGVRHVGGIHVLRHCFATFLMEAGKDIYSLDVVFTLPHSLNALVDANRKVLLNELFHVVGWVLQRFARDPRWRLEGELGTIAILHTWTQKLRLHFHIHCLIPGGVWRAETGEWVPCRGKWLFRKDSLADAFGNRFIKRLRSLRAREKLAYGGRAAPLAGEVAWEKLLERLAATKWVVYPKATETNPDHAFDYLARYTHKVAISDHRIKALGNGTVTYTWRDRSDDNTEKLDTLPVATFIRRFCAHILPKGFHRIRYGGWMSAAKRKVILPAIRTAIGVEPPPEPPPESLAERILRTTGTDITLCPHCRKGHLRKTSKQTLPINPRAP